MSLSEKSIFYFFSQNKGVKYLEMLDISAIGKMSYGCRRSDPDLRSIFAGLKIAGDLILIWDQAF